MLGKQSRYHYSREVFFIDNISLTIYKWDNYNNKIAIENMCTSIRMSCSHQNICAELQFVLAYNYNDYYYFNFELGDEVYLYYNGGIVFSGRITDIDFNSTTNTHTFTCFDLAWWIVKSNVTFNFDNIPVKDAIRLIYGDIELSAYDSPEEELGDNARILIGNHLIKNKPAATVLKAIMTEVSKKTNQYYYIHMNTTGRVIITECDKYYSGLTIQESSKDIVDGNLIEYEISKSMQNMVNQVKIYDSTYKIRAIYNNIGYNPKRYGTIQDTVMLDEKEDFDAYSSTALKVENNLEQTGQPSEDITVKCLGDINYKVGYGVMVKLPDTIYYDKFMYIIASEWEWTRDGNFISTLKLSTSKHKDLVEWEDVEEKQENENVNNGDNSENEVIKKAIKWATDTALDDAHGYSQSTRWGQDYDCSSFVISAYQYAGLDVRGSGANSTHDMVKGFTACGFEKIDGFDKSNGSDLKAGDILLNIEKHACLYVGDGKVANCSQDYDGQRGDSTGKEIRIQPYYLYHAGWDCILRLKVKNNSSNNSSNGSFSNEIIEFLKGWEGFTPTWDKSSSYGAIGYGTDASGEVGSKVKAQGIKSCTKPQAEEWLKEELEQNLSDINSRLSSHNISLTNNKKECLLSMCYNMGINNLDKYIMPWVYNQTGSADAGLLKVTNGGLEGLVKRRKAEINIWKNGDYSARP